MPQTITALEQANPPNESPENEFLEILKSEDPVALLRNKVNEYLNREKALLDNRTRNLLNSTGFMHLPLSAGKQFSMMKSWGVLMKQAESCCFQSLNLINYNKDRVSCVWESMTELQSSFFTAASSLLSLEVSLSSVASDSKRSVVSAIALRNLSFFSS